MKYFNLGNAAQNRFGRKFSSTRLNVNDGSASASQANLATSKVQLPQHFSIDGVDGISVTQVQMTPAADVCTALNLQDDHIPVESATTHQDPSLKSDFDLANLV